MLEPIFDITIGIHTFDDSPNNVIGAGAITVLGPDIEDIVAVSAIFDHSPFAVLFFKKVNKMTVVQRIDDPVFSYCFR